MINPFSEDKNPHPYKSHATDEAMKFFTAKTLGQSRRESLLGKEWEAIV